MIVVKIIGWILAAIALAAAGFVLFIGYMSYTGVNPFQ